MNCPFELSCIVGIDSNGKARTLYDIEGQGHPTMGVGNIVTGTNDIKIYLMGAPEHYGPSFFRATGDEKFVQQGLRVSEASGGRDPNGDAFLTVVAHDDQNTVVPVANWPKLSSFANIQVSGMWLPKIQRLSDTARLIENFNQPSLPQWSVVDPDQRFSVDPLETGTLLVHVTHNPVDWWKNVMFTPKLALDDGENEFVLRWDWDWDDSNSGQMALAVGLTTGTNFRQVIRAHTGNTTNGTEMRCQVWNNDTKVFDETTTQVVKGKRVGIRYNKSTHAITFERWDDTANPPAWQTLKTTNVDLDANVFSAHVTLKDFSNNVGARLYRMNSLDLGSNAYTTEFPQNTGSINVC